MRISQAQQVHSSANQAGTSDQFLNLARMAKLTLLAMAASLLLITCRCHASATTTSNFHATPAQAQAPDQSSNAVAPGSEADSQNVRVVRLSDVEGTVQIARHNQTEFSHAVMNMPLTQGTEIETGPDGRAEIEFEDGSVARITPSSTLSLVDLSTSSTGSLGTTLEQPKGLVYYELRSDPRSTFTVEFGDSKVVPTANSTFRINLTSNPAELAVIDGHVEVQGTNSATATPVPQGKTIELKPSGSSPYTVADGIVPNGFDEWNDQRDEEAAKQAAKQTTARNQQGGGSMLEGGWGWGDLDAYGGWYPVPGYGMVWQPYGAGPGFDPYGYGAWANMGGLGVSWVSGYPWGWLPFQCGGWSNIGGFGWGWMPGGCGFGMGFGMGIGMGYGYGGYYGGGYYGGRYWNNHPGRTGYGHGAPGWGGGTARIYSAPPGYHVPVAPTSLRNGMNGARPGENIVHVGTAASAARGFTGHGQANHARAINYNGTKIEPLHSVSRGASIPIRNAALMRSAPRTAFRSGTFGRFQASTRALANRGAPGLRGGNMFRGTAGQVRTSSFNNMRAANAAAFRSRGAFGNHATFGSHGSFHGSTPSFGGGGVRGGSFGGGFHGFSGGGFHGGGGGFHGGGGGFHGGGGGGGFHGGGGSFGGGGGHGGGGGGGGHH